MWVALACENQGWLSSLKTGEGTAAIGPLSIDLVSTWLQNLPISWQMTVLSILGVTYSWYSLTAAICILFVISGCSVPNIPHLRDSREKEWIKIKGSCIICKGGLYGQVTQDGSFLALCISPVWPVPALPMPYSQNWPSYLLAPGIN